MFIDTNDVAELHSKIFDNEKLVLGGNTSLTETMNIFAELSAKSKDFKYLEELRKHIDLVANVPVRNVSRNEVIDIFLFCQFYKI